MLKSENSTSLIGKLIQTLIKNESLELKPEVMKKIKWFCRESPKNIAHVYHLLMTQLCRDNSKIRYIVLLAINDLFLRSNAFRNLVEKDLNELLELTLETNPNKLLPPPKSVADRLKIKAQCFIKDWHNKFGNERQIMRLGFAYLKNCRKINFDNPQQVGFGHRARESSRRAINLAEKIIRTKKEMESAEPDIRNAVLQIENCFRLVLPLPNDLFNSTDFAAPNFAIPPIAMNNVATNCEENSVRSESNVEASLRHHGIHNIQIGLNIQFDQISVNIERNVNNAPILDMMNELYVQMCKTYMPMVLSWLKVFTKGENCLDLIKKAIDLKQILESSMFKFKEIKFESKISCPDVPAEESEESDSDFEDVEEKEGFEATVESNIEAGPTPSTSGADKTNERGGSGAVQHTCRALLPSGKLCPRQDKLKCPFHGTIVARNEHGMPIHDKDQSTSLDRPSTSHQTFPDWQDPQLLKDIEAQTGVNLQLPDKRTSSKHMGPKCKNSTNPKSKSSSESTYSRLYKKLFKKGRKKFC